MRFKFYSTTSLQLLLVDDDSEPALKIHSLLLLSLRLVYRLYELLVLRFASLIKHSLLLVQLVLQVLVLIHLFLQLSLARQLALFDTQFEFAHLLSLLFVCGLLILFHLRTLLCDLAKLLTNRALIS